ncbi:hypothetical protein [Clostridium sp.]|uniref:hypothetical protein n=1 Tax=Clostridium sp. TaxID=1506 RepID=UPI0026305F36|nr:hypothetical protein [Clostridium sp.]
MNKAINDASLVKAGDIYQYYIALRDCFSMEVDEKLQIERNGDVSVISGVAANSFQKEVKHHFGDKNLIDRDVDFWKTLANWYVEYNRIEMFSKLILYTTANILTKSPFFEWNNLKESKKLIILKNIGKIEKDREEKFRKYYNIIFSDDNYDEEKLLKILSRFNIECSKNQISGISLEFSSYVGHIPQINRDQYIAALLGQILSKIKDPPHHWEVTREEFDLILQKTSPAFSDPNKVPLPTDFLNEEIPLKEAELLKQKNFIKAIKDIEYQCQIPYAVTDYWKAEMTVLKYFTDDLLYTRSLPAYKNNLKDKLKFTKDKKELRFKTADRNIQLIESKDMFADVMAWDAKDFGSVIGNQGYFQRGIIHSIVDEKKFVWDIGEENEH